MVTGLSPEMEIQGSLPSFLVGFIVVVVVDDDDDDDDDDII